MKKNSSGMIKLIAFMLLFRWTGVLSAQEHELSVKSFRKLENDLDARVNEPKKDQNGDLSAILKIVTTQKGFTFDCGQIGIVKTIQKPSEIWVYVPYGVKRLSIFHPQLGILRDYLFSETIEKASVYELVLISGTVTTTVQESIVSQWLVITPEPADALVYVDDKFVKNGIYQGKLKPGNHTYRVEGPLYHSEAGRIEIGNSKKEMTVKLKPAFGYCSITTEPETGAKVLIDGRLLNRTTPCQSDPLSSGTHTVEVIKELFQPAKQILTIQEGKTTEAKLLLAQNFGELTVNLPVDAELFVNNQSKGKGNWNGRLGAGIYTLEAKMDRHRTDKKDIEVVVGEKQNINLEPAPILGSIDFVTNPPGATIVIDEKNYGTTPNTVNKLLIGNYSIKLMLPGFNTIARTITISEGKNTELNENLSKENISDALTNSIAAPKDRTNDVLRKHKKANWIWSASTLVNSMTGTIVLLQSNKLCAQYKQATNEAATLHQKVKTLDIIYPVCYALAGFSAFELILQSAKLKKIKKSMIDIQVFPIPEGAALNLSYKF